MKNIFSSWIVVPLLILIFFVDDSISWGSSNDFIVHQKISLTQKSDGFDGVLEILRDSRVTDSDIKLMQMHDPDLDLSKKSKFKSTPLKSAVVRLASRNGQVIQSLNLENPYASLESITTVEPGKRTLLLTEDCYNVSINKVGHGKESKDRRGNSDLSDEKSKNSMEFCSECKWKWKRYSQG